MVVPPGRWGQMVTSTGQGHPFFFREQLLGLFRQSYTAIPASRLACAFAFEDRAIAAEWAKQGGQVLHQVAAADPQLPSVRLDMLWIIWMGEPGSTFETNLTRCRAYWNGQSTADVSSVANPAWEWLFAGGLRMIAPEGA